MADNVPVTPGSGDVIAADDVGGVKHQRVKISVGADGAATDVVQPADNLGQTIILPAGNMVFNTGSGTWYMSRSANADAVSGQSLLAGGSMLYNDVAVAWNRQRGNTEGTLLASAARTTTTASATQTNYNARGVMLTLNVTAASGTGGLVVAVRMADQVSGQPVDDLIGAALTATGTYGFQYYPGASPAADTAGSAKVNKHVSGVLARTWAAYVQHNDASSYTYSLGYTLIL